MKRKSVLVMTDSPKLHTGFGMVGRHVWSYLNRTGKYDIKCVGWFDQNTNEEITYPVVSTRKDQKGRPTQKDKYAHESFPSYVDKFKPDLVWTLGDMWMVDHVALSEKRDSFKWIGYFPIDGQPVPSKWGKTLDAMDVAVAYGKWGAKVASRCTDRKDMKYIYHGVDTKKFRPIEGFDKVTSKKSLLGLREDKKIIGVVARNQPRKAFDKIFEALFYIANGKYIKCSECNNVTVYPYDIVDKTFQYIKECKHCKSKKVSTGNARDDVRLYLHACPVDCGWDLLDLQRDYDIQGMVLVNPHIKIGAGVSDTVLASIYNCFDVFTLPTRGEGFGLPILEAMACGVPVVVTDYSAHTEWVGDGGELVPPAALVAEPLTNIRRAVIDMNFYVTSLLRMLDDTELATQKGIAARKAAEKFDWSIILPQWEELIDSILYASGAPAKVKPEELEYTLEEI